MPRTLEDALGDPVTHRRILAATGAYPDAKATAANLDALLKITSTKVAKRALEFVEGVGDYLVIRRSFYK